MHKDLHQSDLAQDEQGMNKVDGQIQSQLKHRRLEDIFRNHCIAQILSSKIAAVFSCLG